MYIVLVTSDLIIDSYYMSFILVPFLKRAPTIIIHLARNAEKGGGVLMSIIFRNFNHSFICPNSGFRLFHTPIT